MDDQSINIKKMNKRIKRLLIKNDQLYDQNDEIINKIDLINNNKVVLTGKNKDQYRLIIIKLNRDPEDYDDGDTFFEYTALNVMSMSLKKRMVGYSQRYPEMEILMEIEYSPHLLNLWHQIKSQLGSGKNNKIFIKGCKFNLIKKYTEKKLVQDITKIHDERFVNDC